MTFNVQDQKPLVNIGLDHKLGHLVVGFLKSKTKIIIPGVYNRHKFIPRIVAHLMINPDWLEVAGKAD